MPPLRHDGQHPILLVVLYEHTPETTVVAKRHRAVGTARCEEVCGRTSLDGLGTPSLALRRQIKLDEAAVALRNLPERRSKHTFDIPAARLWLRSVPIANALIQGHGRRSAALKTEHKH
ncbi:MAG: hypothetical protein AAFX56_06540 [Pseudomonadota bacterium]